MLIRDQYKPANPFSERQAPWTIQFTKHFWDYARDQYSLGIRPTAIAWFAPYLLGLFGLVRHLQREEDLRHAPGDLPDHQRGDGLLPQLQDQRGPGT